MENMTTIENHYLTLTEDELMNVEGGRILHCYYCGYCCMENWSSSSIWTKPRLFN